MSLGTGLGCLGQLGHRIHDAWELDQEPRANADESQLSTMTLVGLWRVFFTLETGLSWARETKAWERWSCPHIEEEEMGAPERRSVP